MRKKTRSIPPKKKNTGYGLPTASKIYGVAITLIAEATQFIEDATETYFAGIISGTYGQTTGPILKA